MQLSTIKIDDFLMGTPHRASVSALAAAWKLKIPASKKPTKGGENNGVLSFNHWNMGEWKNH